MNKLKTIKNIKNILKHNGCFSIGELDYFDSSPCIGSMGNIVGLAEYFTEDYAEINVYNTSSYSSDAIENYEEKYENLSEEVLEQIYLLCQEYEAQTLKTEKRISN
jgi:hypothetical protein